MQKFHSPCFGRSFLLFLALLITNSISAQDIHSYYDEHKNDEGMESGKVPPKLASFFVDEEYPKVIDVLRSLRSLKYLNYWGESDKIVHYSTSAINAITGHEHMLTESQKGRNVNIYGIKKRGKIRKILVVVETKAQFILMIAKGKLSQHQLKQLPALSEEIQ